MPTPTPEPPTPTPAPNQPPAVVPTVAPPAGCVDGMAWVADLNYDDKDMTAPALIPPGQPFVKSWRVRNSGTCTWNSSYFLGYDHGNTPASSMGGQPVYVQGTWRRARPTTSASTWWRPPPPASFRASGRCAMPKVEALARRSGWASACLRRCSRRQPPPKRPWPALRSRPIRPTSSRANAPQSAGTRSTSKRCTTTSKGRTGRTTAWPARAAAKSARSRPPPTICGW